MASLRDLIPGSDLSAAPTVGTLIPGSAGAPSASNLLRGATFGPSSLAEDDLRQAQGMSQAGLGFKSGRLGLEADRRAAEEMSARAGGRLREADDLRTNITALKERAGVFAPTEQDVAKLNWEPGRIVDYTLGAAGQLPASMMDNVAAEAGLGGAGKLISAIPHPAAKLAGGALQLAGPLTSYLMNAKQARGEFYNDAAEDPELMRTKSAQDINTAGQVQGAVSGLWDTAMPHAIGGRLIGNKGLRAFDKLGLGTKMAIDHAGEAGTEVLQDVGKKAALGYLNPNRDTSGDVNDYLNDAAGAALGMAPMSAGSHLASRGYARLGVKDDAGSDVSGKPGVAPGAPTAPAAPPKDETLAASFARGAKAKAQNVPSAEATAWRDTLAGEGEGAIEEQLANSHAGLTKEMSARAAAGDATAKKHLDALNAVDMNDPLSMFDQPAEDARKAAFEHVLGTGISQEADDRLIKAHEAAKAGRRLNEQVDPGDLGGRTVTGGGDNVGGGLVGPPVTLATKGARAEFDQRTKLAGNLLADAAAGARGGAKRLEGVAKALGAEIVEYGAKSLAKPSAGGVARMGRMGRAIVNLVGKNRAEQVLDDVGRAAGIEGTKLFEGLRGHVILAADQHAYQKQERLDRTAAADELLKVVPARAQNILRDNGMDLTTSEGKEHLLDRVEAYFDGEDDRPHKKFTALFGKDGVEAMRVVMGQPMVGRTKQEFDEQDEQEAAASAKTAAAKDSDGVGESAAEDGAARERQNAEKNVENAPGARDYTFFGGRSASGKEGKHPFVADAKNGNLPGLMHLDSVDKSTGENSLEGLKDKLFAKLGGHDKKGQKIFRLVKALRDGEVGPAAPIGDDVGDRSADAPSLVKGDLAVGGTRIRTTSAKEVLDHHKVSPTERVEVMRNYLARMKGGKVVLARDDPTIQQIQTTDRKIAKLEKTTVKEHVVAVGPKGALTVDNPAYEELRSLKALREQTAAKLADKIGVEYREGMTIAQMADAYFSEAHLVVAEQMAEKDQLRVTRSDVVEWVRLGARYLKRTDLAASEARDEARKAGKSKDEVEAAGVAAANKMAADMNLLRFKSKDAVADDGIAVVPAHELAAWVYENRTDHAEKHYNSVESRALAYRAAIMEGVAALVADGFADELPYMANEGGNIESFGKGFPPSLRLGGVAQADLDAIKAQRVERRADEPREGAYLADTMRKDARRIAGHQAEVSEEQNAKDDESVRNTDADELVDEGREAAPLNRTPVAKLIAGKQDATRFWDAPAAEAREPALPTNPLADERGFVGPLPGANPESRAGKFPLAPETVDTRTDDTSRTPLDAERKQTKGVPTDRTDLRNRNSMMDAALDKIDALTPMNAMSKAGEVARSILGVMSQGMEVVNGKLRPLAGAAPADPRSGFERMQRLVSALRQAQFRPAGDLRPVGGKQYAAPLAHILTPNNIAWMVSLAKNPQKAKVSLELMRSETADSLTKEGGLSQVDKTALARLLTGNEKLPSPKAVEALEKLSWSARMARKAAKDKAAKEAAETDAKIAAKRAGPVEAVVPKSEPVAAPAPKAELADRKFNEQNTPAGVQAPVFSSDEAVVKARAYIAKVLGPSVKVETAKLLGHMGEWVEADNTIKLSLAAGSGILSVAYHEALHGLFSRLVKNSPEAAATLQRVMSEPKMLERLQALLSREPAALTAITTGPHAAEERVAYAYQFWAAGQLDLDKPATTMFDKFRRLLRKVFGMVRDSETALDVLTAFHDGKLAEPSAAGKVIADILARQTWNEDVKRKFDKTLQHIHSSVAVSNQVMRTSESEAARALAPMFFTNPGRESDGAEREGYLNARTRVVRQYTNFLYQAVKRLSPRDMEDAARHMQLKTPVDKIAYAPVAKAVGELRALTKRYYQFAVAAGLKLEYLGDDHYPRVWDLAKLVEGKDAFVAMLMNPQYAAPMAAALAFANADSTKPQVTKQDVALMMHRHLMEKNGVEEKGLETDHGDIILSPFFASQKERSFKWLADEDTEPFLEKDLVGAMSRYLHQGVRAAEFARRFGEGGRGLRALLAMQGDVALDGGKIAEHGIIAKQLYEAAAKQGMIAGPELEGWVARRMDDLRKATAAQEGSLGGDISPTFRKLSSAAMAYQNLRLLPMSLFAAFADPLSLAARGPGLAGAVEAFTGGLKDVWARWKDAASDMPAERVRSVWDKMAEACGAVDTHMFLEQIGKAHTSEFMTDFARKSNRLLFMANGLTAWDRSMRVTATKYAALFLQDHKSLPDKKHSARWLAEVGLTADEIPLDDAGNLIYDRHILAATRITKGMTDDEKGAVLEQATVEMDKIHYALTRWVEGAVLTPNAAQRPSWASDPRWAVLFHLKQFTYSFQDTVMKRAFNEATQGNMNPIGALAAAVPTMLVSDILKGFVVGGGSLPDYMKTMSLGDQLAHSVSRAGLGGVSQFGIDALHDPAGLFGPTVDQVVKMVTHPADILSNLHDAVPGLRMIKGLPDLSRAVE